VTTVGEMANALSRAVGGPSPLITGDCRLGDVRHNAPPTVRLLDACSAGVPRLILLLASPTCRLRDEDQFRGGVPIFDDAVRLGSSVEGKSLDLDHEFALFQ
jgi:hypothetical protein